MWKLLQHTLFVGVDTDEPFTDYGWIKRPRLEIAPPPFSLDARKTYLRAQLQPFDDDWICALRANAQAAARTIATGGSAKLEGYYPIDLKTLPGDQALEIRDERIARRRAALNEAETLVQGARDEAARKAALVAEQARQQAAKAEAERQQAAREEQWKRETEQRQQAAEQERQRKEALKVRLSQPINLVGRFGAEFVLGTRIDDGSDFLVSAGHLQHMLVVGTTGSGKSIFLHQLVYQLTYHVTEVEKIYIVDLKGGIEFNRYRDSERVSLIWEFAEFAKVLERLNAVMLAREDEMRARNLRTWPGSRVFVIVDEYAEIQSEIDSAMSREEKQAARTVSVALVRLSRRARALGIVLICALQKATTDAMDSALRANLGIRVCLRVNSRQFAASVLDDLDCLPADPVTLKRGRFLYYDAARDVLEYAVAQVAPGVIIDEEDTGGV